MSGCFLFPSLSAPVVCTCGGADFGAAGCVGQRRAQSQFSSWCNVLHRQAGAGGMQLTSAISCASGMVCVFPACVIACDVCSCCMLALCTLQNGWRMCYTGGGGGVGLDTLPGSGLIGRGSRVLA